MQAMQGSMAAMTIGTKAPILSWWLSGGVSAANAVAAYAPKGAASLAASYVNLANPGTYNAAPGTAPTWDAVNGWKFSSASLQYLITGIIPDGSYTAILKFADCTTSAASRAMLGARNADATSRLEMWPAYDSVGSGRAILAHGSATVLSYAISSGVIAIAGAKAYRDGVDLGVTFTVGGSAGAGIMIGCANINGTPTYFGTGNVQALSLYNSALTQTQVVAIGAAMP